jgi:hypothetical protein
VSEGASFLDFSLNNGCSDSYKIVYGQMSLCPLSCGTLWFLNALSRQPFWDSHHTSLSHSYWHRFGRAGEPQLATSEDSPSFWFRNAGADHSYMRVSCDLDWFGMPTYEELPSSRRSDRNSELGT